MQGVELSVGTHIEAKAPLRFGSTTLCRSSNPTAKTHPRVDPSPLRSSLLRQQ